MQEMQSKRPKFHNFPGPSTTHASVPGKRALGTCYSLPTPEVLLPSKILIETPG